MDCRARSSLVSFAPRRALPRRGRARSFRRHALTGRFVRGKPTAHLTIFGKAILIKPDLGTKRVCPSCAARFYDLQKRPIECPKCAFTFEPEMLLKQRRPRATEPVKPAVVETEDEELEENEEEEEAAEAEEPDAEEEDAPVVEADDPEAAEEEEAAAPEAVEAEEFEEEIEDDEDDDNLLEEVEEDEDDVSGIIDADIEKDEP
jgi:uncharacterized protein (TIGR02300 family)